MTDLVFRKEYAVHTYETDIRGLARTTSLLNYLQDAAGEHAGRLGLSVLDLVKRGMTWVLSRYHVLVYRYPAMGTRLEITTWPSGKSGYFATRDFEAADGTGGAILSATSSWMVLELERKQPRKVDDVIDIAYAVDKRALDDPFDSLPVLSERQSELRFRVGSADLDWNRHVNNAVYVHWALEPVPRDVLMSLRPVEIEVSYRAETFYGEEVLSAVERLPDDGRGPAFLHQIVNAATGAELTRLRTRWGEV
ncbi:MAG TPA: acyl-ACP thioesterase [Candidatus Aminicenantes bacterium]|nr:acyl-ACP thioesterase [Candidatus Aminicenantes bacterium]HDT13109.1 acyl-ACP thioesterase [Candidatus Aminicenantes bacterium]